MRDATAMTPIPQGHKMIHLRTIDPPVLSERFPRDPSGTVSEPSGSVPTRAKPTGEFRERAD